MQELKTYRATQGDTWDLIAKTQLGSEYAMTTLIHANSDKVSIRIFKGGEVLIIPNEEIAAKIITPPWGK